VFKIYYEHAGGLFSAVEACSKAVFRGGHPYGKSPCFLRLGFHESSDVDWAGQEFTMSNMEVLHD